MFLELNDSALNKLRLLLENSHSVTLYHHWAAARACVTVCVYVCVLQRVCVYIRVCGIQHSPGLILHSFLFITVTSNKHMEPLVVEFFGSKSRVNGKPQPPHTYTHTQSHTSTERERERGLSDVSSSPSGWRCSAAVFISQIKRVMSRVLIRVQIKSVRAG